MFRHVLDPTVRDTSAEALGTAMKVVGEKGISPFLTDVDNIKMTKVSPGFDLSCCSFSFKQF